MPPPVRRERTSLYISPVIMSPTPANSAGYNIMASEEAAAAAAVEPAEAATSGNDGGQDPYPAERVRRSDYNV